MSKTRAIILAAGQGTRLRPHTDDRPKGLVEFGGQSIIRHQLDVLDAAGVEVGIVTGYRKDQIEALGRTTFFNPDFETTNMVVSLMAAREWLLSGSDILVCYGDIVYTPEVLRAILSDDAPFSTTIDKNWQALWEMRQEDPINDAETLKWRRDEAGKSLGSIVELGKKPKSLSEIEGQYMGLIKWSPEFARTAVEAFDSLAPEGPYDGKDRNNMYMTSFLQLLIGAGHELRGVEVESGWLETDTVADLELYDSKLNDGSLRPFWWPEGRA